MKLTWILGLLLLNNIALWAQEIVFQNQGKYSIQYQAENCQWQLLNTTTKEAIIKSNDIQKMNFVDNDLLYVQENYMPKYYLLLEDKWQLLAYQQVTFLEDDFLLVRSGNYKGIISKTGNGLIPLQYEEIIELNKFFLLKKADKWFLWNKKDKNFILSISEEPWFLPELKKAGKKANFLFWKGSSVDIVIFDLHTLEQKYTVLPLAEYFTMGLWAGQAKKVENLQMQMLNPSLWILQKDNQFGILNDKRTLVLPTLYDHIEIDKNYPHLLHIKEKGYWGVWDSEQQNWLIAIDKKQQMPYSLFNEKTWAVKEKDIFEINSLSKEKLSLKADVYKVLNAAYLAYSVEGKWGVLSLETLKTIIAPQYEHIEMLNKDLLQVREKGQEDFIINLSDKKITCWK